ncbi:hypothetical protein [uncultured Treponema sp.]|uniref:hypothetical protein n=1 Tax=uncultured Treponema sp. TaxID=162155 RepID=UPI0025EB9BA2|nr:hypothetical protein [uncultured Treponema sp.]
MTERYYLEIFQSFGCEDIWQNKAMQQQLQFACRRENFDFLFEVFQPFILAEKRIDFI